MAFNFQSWLSFPAVPAPPAPPVTLPVQIVAPDTLPVQIVAPDTLPVQIVAPDTLPVQIVAPDTLQVVVLPSTAISYSAAVLNLMPASSATDIFTISGSNSKIITVAKVILTGIKTTPGNIDLLVLKRSTANTAGTFSLIVSVPHKPASPAALAAVKAYSANPVTGSLVGVVQTSKFFIANASNLGDKFEFSQPVVLNSADEILAVNLNGQSLLGGSFNISVEWAES